MEPHLLRNLRERARSLKRETYALYLAARHPETPLAARILVGFIIAYALSPIDLIPDFIPIIGYLDDIILLPALIALALRLIPRHVLADCRSQAAAALDPRAPSSRKAAAIIIVIWVAAAVVIALAAIRHFRP